MNVTAPISRPAYTTTVRVEYVDWLAENDQLLRDWYRMTSEWEPAQHPADYADFVRVQFDIACELDSVLTDGLYEVQLAESDAEDSPNEEAP